jgi:hypothetical protein
VTLAGASAGATRSGTLLLRLRLRCAAGASACIGRATLQAPGSAAARRRAARPLTLASATFAIAGGQTRTVTLRLRPPTRALLARSHSLRTRLTIVDHDTAGMRHGTHVTIVLRPANGG